MKVKLSFKLSECQNFASIPDFQKGKFCFELNEKVWEKKSLKEINSSNL